MRTITKARRDFRLGSTLRWLVHRAVRGRGIFRSKLPGSSLVFHTLTRDGLTRHLAKYGAHEPKLTRWVERHLADRTQRGIVVDIGANFGWFTLHCAQSKNVETVLACEPEIFNLYLLNQNISKNAIDKVVVAPWAIGAKQGRAKLHLYKESNLGRHSLVVDHGLGARTVPVFDLDTTLALFELDDSPIHLMKIDIEGYELEAIRGADRALERSEAVALEFSPARMRDAGLPVEELIDRLIDKGFLPFEIGGNDELVSRVREQLIGSERQVDLVWLRGSLPD